jgi:hypothetical protein
MPNIAIICSVERLFGSYGQLSNAAYFGMNLSAALVGQETDVTEANKVFLNPWSWNIIGLKAWVGTAADPNQGQPVVLQLVPPGQIQNRDLIIQALLSERSQGPSSYLFSEGPESPSFETKTWHSLLAHASTYPAPVPQALNLALHFSIANLPATGNLFVAPILDVGGGDPKNPVTIEQAPAAPAAGKPAITIVPAAAAGQIGFAKWKYVDPPAGQLPMVGYVNPIDVTEQPAKGSFIDFTNLWIKGVEQTENWLPQLESRVAEAFDLARAILDFAKSASLPLTAIRDSFFAALHDRANAGLFFAPDGSCLASYLIKQCQQTLNDKGDPAPLIQALAAYEQKLVLDDWKKLLSKTIPEGPSTDLATETALENWWGLLADDRVLARLIYAQWQNASSPSPRAQSLWNTIEGTLQNQVLPSVQLRKRYALATIGNLSYPAPNQTTPPDPAHELWQLIAAGGNIPANMADLLVRYAKVRFGGGDATDQKRYELLIHPAAAPLPSDPANFLTKFANDFYNNVIKPPEAKDTQESGQAAPMSTPAPPGITLQLDTTDTLSNVKEDEDFQRRMTGAGVLMRKKGGTWRCLNMAAIYSRNGGSSPDAPIYPTGAVVPYRLDYHNGVRQAFVTYNNHPLVAESPAAPLAGSLQLTDKQPTDFDSVAASPSLLVYKIDFSGAASNPQIFSTWAVLPGLFYSGDDQAYEFLAFAMTNSGAIPAELAASETKDAQGNITPAIPWQIRSAQSFSAANLVPIEAGYKRRVQVGALRLRDDKGQVLTETSKLLPLPDGVVPKFHDLAPSDETQPLLFLYPRGQSGTDSFQFSARPPATDLNTWDQWVGPGNQEQRIRAWADYHTNSPQAPVPNPLALDSNRVTFDDPAVTGLLANLTQRWPANGKKITLQNPVQFDHTTSLYQAPAIPVSCSIGAASLEPPASAGAPLLVQVPANEVWQLSIVPLVAGAAKFESGVLGVAQDGPLPASAFQVVIEVASPQLPSPEEIWSALQLPQSNDGATSFNVTLTPGVSDSDTPWANVRSVELLRQAWRWSGRPFAAFENFPQAQLDPTPGGTETPAMLWEAEAFGERDDSDHIAIPSQVNFVRPIQKTSPPVVLHSEDLSSDLRTHYYRFALRVTSRYSGILSASQQTSQVPLVTPSGNGFTIWKRYWINNRCTSPIPKPKIKIILPLTSAEEQSDSVPGLLCVLDEPWYNIGGLSEQLQAEIAKTDIQGPISTPFANAPFEFGPDPILTGDASFMAPSDDPTLQMNGPFGYSFDTNTTAPLIVASSFIVRPPAAPPGKNLAWYFAKLRFRRVIGNLQSDPTDPQWVQFVADFTRFQTSMGMISIKDLAVRSLTDSSFQLLIGGVVADLQSPANFEIWTVVTQKVTDAFGRQGQERFVGIASYDSKTKTFMLTTRLPATFVVRLLEIQRQGNAGSDLLSDLFSDAPGLPDALARVVRISPLVEGEK